MYNRILVVDDELGVREMLRNRLEVMGFEVVTAANGREGLGLIIKEALGDRPIGGILLDMAMPVMDGLAMLREVRDRHPEIPVVMMSSDEKTDLLKTALKEGASDFLNKPIDGARLCQLCLTVFLNEAN